MSSTDAPARMHKLLDPDALELIRSTIDKYKTGLEVWWDAVPDVLQIPIAGADGRPAGIHHQPVTKIIMGTRGLALGHENFVWHVIMTDPIPQAQVLENNIIQGIESLNQQRASQLNGPSTSFGQAKGN